MHTHGQLFAFRPASVNAYASEDASSDDLVPLKNMTATDAGAWILQQTPPSFQAS